MSIKDRLSHLNLNDDQGMQNYHYKDVFKNPNKLPINQIHLEKSWRELRKDLPKDFDLLTASAKEIESTYFVKKVEVIPALDIRWLTKTILNKYEPYLFFQEKEENVNFLLKNTLFFESLEYLLSCNYHQFWCTILFEPSAAVALRSFLFNPILPYQVDYLEGEYLQVYNSVFNKFLLVYERLLTFKQSEIEYMSESFGLSKLIDKMLLNLPIVITLAFLYKDSNVEFINRLANLYFNNSSQIDFLVKEVEATVEQTLIILEMIGGHLCGFDETAVIVPISLEPRPPVFSLSWVYSVVSYILSTVMAANALFRIHKPAVEIALEKSFPFRLPFIYVSVYKEIYELLNEREEIETQKDLYKKIIQEINLGRSEFVELYHTFVSFCLDEALKHMGDKLKQEHTVENYLKLLTTALEDDYFICDYNAAYNVANQNEMFESCCDIDPTRTQFIVSCINKLPRNRKLQELSKLKRQTIESVFRDFRPEVEEEPEVFEPQPGPSTEAAQFSEGEIDEKIRSILDMFPHLGDGFIYQCLESYDFNASDVINAILENNLPPHLTEIPFDQIRIPPEPEPEQPVLAYRGKKPDYDDALKLLNDKQAIKDIKNLVLEAEGVKYDYDYMYDDEYDDRFDDDVSIKVPDNPLSEELATFNPNRQNRDREQSESEESSEEEESAGKPSDRNNRAFCEDPAILRAKREAKFKGKGPIPSQSQSKPKKDVVGNPKGQGQNQDTLFNRHKKSVNKSSRANHNRKSGAQWKRNKGMIPS